jgi:hypothetical protein
VLGPSDLESFRVLAQTRLRADLDSRLASRSAALGGFLIHADKVQQNALTDVVAARLAADGDVALARINGYASGFPVLPTEEQWRTLLEPLRPHGRNAKRYGAQPLEGDLLNEFNGNAITSQFKSQIRRLLLSIQEN